MPAWIERPTIDLELALPPEERYARFPDAVLASGQRLLAAIMQEIPVQARALAYWVRLRTAGRFHKEAVALASTIAAENASGSANSIRPFRLKTSHADATTRPQKASGTLIASTVAK